MGSSRSGSRPGTLGSFEVLREIAEGGMGVVYLARQPALDRHVVLKKIRRDVLSDSCAVERFHREARAAASVHHQNVVAVYDCFTVRGDHYIAQELVDGEDLRSVLNQTGRLEPRVAQLIALEVIRGLEEIHARGIVHRDLKPANILIGTGGETKIADFGIALEGNGEGLTRPGTLVGSVPYLSPEQMLGERVGYRSDLFLFGILLYEMITGMPPFEESNGDSTDTLLERMQQGYYVPPGRRAPRVPFYLTRLIRACLRPRPDRRVRSATEIRRRLERHLAEISPTDCRREIAAFLREQPFVKPTADGTTPMPIEPPRGADWNRRVRTWLAPAAAATLLGIVGLMGYAMGRTDRVTEVAPARSEPARPIEHTASASLSVAGPVVSDAEVESAPAEDRTQPLPAAADTKTVPAVPVEPARVRFVVIPWARVLLDDGTELTTPRAAPVALDPGRHRVVFEHPRFGTVETTLELSAGEQRVVRHTFEEASSP
jgi:serine/threonine-protein kinase